VSRIVEFDQRREKNTFDGPDEEALLTKIDYEIMIGDIIEAKTSIQKWSETSEHFKNGNLITEMTNLRLIRQ